jgi:hypothetical protein
VDCSFFRIGFSGVFDSCGLGRARLRTKARTSACVCVARGAPEWIIREGVKRGIDAMSENGSENVRCWQNADPPRPRRPLPKISENFRFWPKSRQKDRVLPQEMDR